jgi:prefoldin subunit 5
MDAKSLLEKLAQEREVLRACISDMDRAIAECQDAKRELLETLQEVDDVLRFAQPNGGS